MNKKEQRLLLSGFARDEGRRTAAELFERYGGAVPFLAILPANAAFHDAIRRGYTDTRVTTDIDAAIGRDVEAWSESCAIELRRRARQAKAQPPT